MSKIAHYLQEHLLGEVTTSPDVRRHFAYDASIFRMVPAVVVYPRNESDVRKTARFAWQLAERGRVLPITARGAGSDTSGAALGSGILIAFTAHMNKILALDPKHETVTLEPGINYSKLEQALFTHGLFLPPYPFSQHYATVGGGLANNAIGEKSVKYGSTLRYAKSLRAVLANGEVIETGPLSKKELSHKMGLSTMEGEIYRALDALLEENVELLQTSLGRQKARYNATGYNIFDVRDKQGNFDLTPLLVGSQGTLGIITEATFQLVNHNPITKLALVGLSNLNDLDAVLPKILELQPSALEMINRAAIEAVLKLTPNQLAGTIDLPKADTYLIVEFDDPREGEQKKALAGLTKLASKAGGFIHEAESPAEQEKIWKIRHSVGVLLAHPQNQSKAVPVAEDVAVPINRVVEFLHRASVIYANNGLVPAAWGHIGDGVILMQPVLDLGNLGDRQKLFRLSDEIYQLTAELEGSMSASRGDGHLRTPYLRRYYGDEIYELMIKVKKIFDPFGLFNPGVKVGTTLDDAVSLMRGEYSLGHRHEHLPRS